MLRVGMKQCSGCRWLSVDCFATNPTTNELYSKCRDCKLKPDASGHVKRDAEVADRRASKEAKLASGELKICNWCGPQPIAAFGINADTGLPYANCKPCHVKMLEAKAAYNQTEAGKAAVKRTKHSEKGKAATKRYEESEKGKAAAKRSQANRQDRRRKSTAKQMDHRIQGASTNLISGRIETSPTFLERTSFTSEAEFRAVVEATFTPGVMTFANHGSVWELDHKIPREAYDFDNPEDIKRCWSPKNVHALTKAANQEKSWQLVDQYIFEAGIECLPLSWKGKFPDNDFKIAHAAKMMARKMIQKEDDMEDDEPPPEDVAGSSSGAMQAPDSDSD